MPPRIEIGRKVGPGPLNDDLRSEFTYSVVTVPAAKPTASDKRQTDRLRTRLRAGQLSDKQSKIIADCLIQDRSSTGARLKLSADCRLPKLFLLRDEVTQDHIWVQLAWQRGRDAGVKLIEP